MCLCVLEQNMFSPEQLEQRAVLLKESNLSAQSLLHGKSRGLPPSTTPPLATSCWEGL